MRIRSSIIAILLLSSLASFALDEAENNPSAAHNPQPTTRKSEVFLKAQSAYDEGRYVEATMLYEELIGNGVNNVEVQYNLANACFKNGDLPEAVGHYRRAWYAAPRDPDIRANMQFALHAAGAIEPARPFLQRLFSTLSQNEWIRAAIAGYLAFTVLVLTGLLIRPAKRVLTRVSLLPAAIILLAAGGWWHWQQLKAQPEWVVVQSGTTALFGPVDGSTAHYKLPLAAIVRQKSIDAKGWLEIEYDAKTGWVKQNHIQRVSP
jgi:tetratricopeptide (TPR) repeat protein